ncbi:glutaredoxin-C9-like [Neltuma alba]|uniref:glutaredoxin-C9-like n=1 Tax=Neltuma alba TaxID=207710 RepID=UPI0010A52B60|nr:glutaredoxin-C9-like [Prosopis alba]XP_028797436.1 glutaredoxin-C9-like [Prosopis alba]
MHQAIPYRTWIPAGARASRDLSPAAATPVEFSGGITAQANGADPGTVATMVSENAVIIIGKRGCCMCHVVQRLLQGLGVNPPVYEVAEADEAAVAAELSRKIGLSGGGQGVQFPAVFVGGKLFGGLERVMSTHISGELVPILKDAGALWL